MSALDPWEYTGVAIYSGEALSALVRAGAPTVPCSRDGMVITRSRLGTEADKYVRTQRWCSVVFRSAHPDTVEYSRGRRYLRTVLEDASLKDAVIAALHLGGADAAEVLVRAVCRE